MTVVRLAAEERLVAAFARYDAVWPDGEPLELAADRLELCRAMLDLDETLPAEVLAQMARDEAAVARAAVLV